MYPDHRPEERPLLEPSIGQNVPMQKGTRGCGPMVWYGMANDQCLAHTTVQAGRYIVKCDTVRRRFSPATTTATFSRSEFFPRVMLLLLGPTPLFLPFLSPPPTSSTLRQPSSPKPFNTPPSFFSKPHLLTTHHEGRFQTRRPCPRHESR